ncbi:asparagine synthetase B [Aurantiacibacter xanthus]|uniref:asparagine synthase (glutamine-hydrolyzing) n=1 Tax=Aurantiacibacter xanthus TaxID=1784712 RepID=A0A3A1P841_9SPHN|nr:asparagine synthase-related protein [Aurantiacibacter xanthus]RIV89757.1 asparagine synthetase B [Aurantiacibacter xanthus]
MAGFALAWSRSQGALSFARLTSAAPASTATTIDDTVFAAADRARGLELAGIWRADNGADLIRELGLPTASRPQDILAAGWSKWSTGLADRLRGPFAIAILQRDTNSLYLARDFMGVEPLFYTRTADGLALSSSPVAARSLADAPGAVRLAAVSSFLAGFPADKTGTYYDNIARLAPGHWMTISPAGERTEPYWTVQAIASRPAPADAGERFRALLDRSVANSASDAEPIGVLLSGGLDSSAISGALMHGRTGGPAVQSLSLTYPGNEGWADGKYIEALRAYFPMEHHSLPSNEHDPLANLESYFPVLDGPSFGYGLSVSNRLLPMAAELGCRSLFHGHGGDEVVSYGTGRLNELAMQGQWRQLWAEAEGAAQLWSMPRWRVLDRYLFHKPQRRWLDRQWKRLHRRAQADSAAELEVQSEALLAHRPAHSAPVAQLSQARHTERDVQETAIASPLQPHALETLVLSGRHHGLQVKLPFFDRDLLEFSVSLPSDWKLRDGYTRYVLRKAIEGRVPDSVTWRRDKNDFTDDFKIGLIERSPHLRDLVSSANGDLQGLVNPQWFGKIWSKVAHDGSSITTSDARALWRVAVLAMWLGSDRRPQAPPRLQPIGVEGNV